MAEPTIVTRIKFEGLDEIKSAFEDMRKSFESSVDRMRRAGEKVGDGLKKSIEGSTAAVRTTGTVGVRSFSLLKSAASGFLSVLKSGVSLLVNLGKIALDVAGKVAAVGAGAFIAVQAFGVKTGQAIDEMGRLADAAGIPVDRFSRLATATRLLGGDVSDLGSGMQSLSERILDAAKDADGSGAKAFAQLGVSVRDSNGNLKSTEQVLNEVADGLARVPRDSLRASAATDIFGGSARALLPILERGSAGLEEYAKKSDRLGTVVTATQAKVSRDLLVKYRQVGEALRGIAFKIGDDLLPFLTQNSEKLANWLADNADNISRFVAKVLKEISGIAADLGKALVGDTGDIQREWIKKVVPAIETARDVFLDLLDIFAGGAATRAPWLKQIGQSLRDAGASAKALGLDILKTAGFAGTKLPTMQEAATAVADAFASLRAGITGKGEVKIPWAANVGKTMSNLASAIGTVAGVIVDNREAITRFASETTALLSNAMAAVQSLLKGENVADENPFAFLNGWRDEAKAIYEGIKADAVWLKDQVLTTYESLKDKMKGAFEWLDWIAKKLGFNNGAELGIVLIVAQATGLLDIFKNIATTLGALSFTAKNMVGTFGDILKVGEKIGGWFLKLGKSRAFTVLLNGAKLLGAALLAIPASVALIVAAVAAAAVLIYVYWDEIKAAALAAWDWIVDKWNGLANWFGGVLDAAKDKGAAFWKWLKAAPGEAWNALVKKWDGFTKWIGNLFERAKAKLSEFWTWLEAAPGRAWDSLVDTWKGFTGFFSGLVDTVKGYFKGLWDGVKNGARDAWSSVKGWFGLGDDEPAAGNADKSPKLATGGIVRGPGGPIGDKIRAWLSSGEGVLNARAVSHYGEGFVHALNGLLVPKTHFASGGIVGNMVPATSGAGLAALHLAIDGRRARGGMYADGDAVRMIRRDFGKTAIASRGPLPRWRGA